MLTKIKRYLTLADQVFQIAESDIDAETKYDLIFSEELSHSLGRIFALDYADPDTSYDEDVQAYVGALREKCSELRTIGEQRRDMTDSTLQAIELAKRIHNGLRGELGTTRSEDSHTIVSFARVIVELSRPHKLDQARVDRGDWQRASGDVSCTGCGHVYYDHPAVPGFEWLHRLCDGRYVKL